MKSDKKEDKNEVFWLTNPSVLIDYNYITNIWPKREDDVNTKLNAVTRCVILLTMMGLVLTQHNKIRLLATTFVTLIAIVFYQHYIIKIKGNLESKEEEGFQNREGGRMGPSRNMDTLSVQRNVNDEERYQEMCGRDGLHEPNNENPMMNVMPMDIKNNPQRPPAQPSYKTCVKQNIRKNIKKNLDPRLFCDLGDELAFSHFERQFHTMPNSQVPNNQKKFAEFCYGNTAMVKDTHMKAPKCDDIIFST